MIWENTKLLLGLLYRPVSSMGRIVDEGYWLYAAVVVAALSMIFHVAVTSVIYNNVEAVYRELPPQPAPDPEAYEAFDEEAVEDFAQPHFVYDRHPLPLVGDRGWWFVSFAPPSFFTAVMGMAVLYIPCLILLVAISGVNASFGVLLRRDYGPLFTCGLMAWAAAHLPFALAGFALEPLGLSEKTALGLWAASSICFGLAASMFSEAKDALEKFIDRRSYDPEGLYYYGKTLEQLEQRDEAREVFARCVEAVKTMPSYRYREQRKWDKLAREQLKKPQITQMRSA